MAGEAAEVALVPLATMVEELRGLANQLNDIARRNEALALKVGQLRERQAGQQSQLLAKDQALAAKEETITELRRRAEVAEAALLRRRNEEAAQAELCRRRQEEAELVRQRTKLEAVRPAQDGPGAQAAPAATQEGGRGVWARWRWRWWGGR